MIKSSWFYSGIWSWFVFPWESNHDPQNFLAGDFLGPGFELAGPGRFPMDFRTCWSFSTLETAELATKNFMMSAPMPLWNHHDVIMSWGVSGRMFQNEPSDPSKGLVKLANNNYPRPYQQTPGAYPNPPTNSLCFGIPFIWGFGDVWGMLQGYVGFPLETNNGNNQLNQTNVIQCGFSIFGRCLTQFYPWHRSIW